MASYRQIHTQIWKDEWFIDLTTEEKLLFIYLFSNESSSFTGLYKISTRVMSFETGLDLGVITDALKRFETDGKVFYRDGVVWVVNMWQYHQNKSPWVQKRFEIDVNMIHDCPLKRAYQYHLDTGIISIDTVSIQYAYPPLKNKKEEKKKEEKQTETTAAVFSHYENNFGLPTAHMRDVILEAIDTYPQEWIIKAIDLTAEAHAKNWKYTAAILERWKKDGFDAGKKNGNGKPQSQDEGYTNVTQQRLAKQNTVK